MQVIGINGSPRKQWNTATLVAKALEGAAAQGAQTELVHLYDLDFKGCTSCFACKTRGGKSYGRCAMKDGLTPVLAKIATADALVIGSPVYFGSVTGETRSFIERLLFPYLTYTVPYGTLFPKKLATAFIYTMNVTEERSREFGYEYFIKVERTLCPTAARDRRVALRFRYLPGGRLFESGDRELRSGPQGEAAGGGAAAGLPAGLRTGETAGRGGTVAA